MIDLSPRQSIILDFIRESVAARGYPPTLEVERLKQKIRQIVAVIGEV